MPLLTNQEEEIPMSGPRESYDPDEVLGHDEPYPADAPELFDDVPEDTEDSLEEWRNGGPKDDYHH